MDAKRDGPVDGIVLAAGRGTRMGQPKARLEVEGETFLERAIRMLRAGGCRYVVAVLSGEDDWAERLADAAGAAVAINDSPGSEQHDSIRVGLAALPHDSAAALILPVDMPLVQHETVRAVIDSYRTGEALIVRPVHEQIAGHPTLFDRSLYAELSREDLAEGARTVIAAHARDVHDVSVPDVAVHTDFDTPDDLRRLE